MSETVLVVDVGSASLKAGYAGEDNPATIIPSIAQKFPHGLEVNNTFYFFFFFFSFTFYFIINWFILLF